jgi:rfaE bifunctional protein nucleotidyltransferase chain/domain
MNDKLKTLEELAEIVDKFKNQGQIVVHCHGVFDLLHPGHIRHFEAAKQLGNILIVTVTEDKYVNKGPGRPAFNQRLRAESVAALNAVNYVAINSWPSAVETIKLLQPDIYVKGGDYLHRESDLTGNIYAEEQSILQLGGKMHFTNDITFSSTQLLNTYFEVFPPSTNSYLQEFRRHYTAEKVIDSIKALSQMRVLILGETIIDEYHFCEVLGNASHSPAITTAFSHAETYPGGVLAIANHLAGFINQVDLVTCVGEVDSRQELISACLKPNITTKLFVRPQSPTTVKRRYLDRDRHQKLFEVSFIEPEPIAPELELEICHFLHEKLKNYDLVIVADFGNGLINQQLIALISNSQKSPFWAVNSHTNSANAGFNLITKYPHIDYACLNQKELQLACHNPYSSPEKLIEQLTNQLSAKVLSVTQGDRGSLSWSSDYRPIIKTPAFATEAIDPSGAGDAYFALTAPCAAANYPPELIGFIGNSAAALVVKFLGNQHSVEPASLFKFIHTLLKSL